MAERKIYCDHIGGKPVLPEVIAAIADCQRNITGNPQALHDQGHQARAKLDLARQQVAALVGATPEEIIFTASGSEANVLALKGIAKAYMTKGKHMITSAVEHFSVLHPIRSLEKEGFEVTSIPVDKEGVVDLQKLSVAIRTDTILVSIMAANSEVGTIQPLAEISKIVKAKGVLLHTDAVAAAGNIPINVAELRVDALSLAGNSFYGPLGTGALYLKKSTRLIPQIEGGVQENGKRAGTENLASIVGMGVAAAIAREQLLPRQDRVNALRDRLIKGLLEKIPKLYLTGSATKRLPGHASFCVEFIEGEGMLLFLNAEGVAVASGSACTSLALKASHVLLAMGVDAALAQGSIVFSLGIDNNEADIEYIIEKFPPIIARLREMSPLYKNN